MGWRKRGAVEDQDFVGDGDEALGDVGHALEVCGPFAVEAGVLLADDDAGHGAVGLGHEDAVVDGAVYATLFTCAAVVAAADEGEACCQERS